MDVGRVGSWQSWEFGELEFGNWELGIEIWGLKLLLAFDLAGFGVDTLHELGDRLLHRLPNW